MANPSELGQYSPCFHVGTDILYFSSIVFTIEILCTLYVIYGAFLKIPRSLCKKRRFVDW